jgi:hypothetical protein
MPELVCVVKPLFLPKSGIHSPLCPKRRADKMKNFNNKSQFKKMWVHRSRWQAESKRKLHTRVFHRSVGRTQTDMEILPIFQNIKWWQVRNRLGSLQG